MQGRDIKGHDGYKMVEYPQELHMKNTQTPNWV